MALAATQPRAQTAIAPSIDPVPVQRTDTYDPNDILTDFVYGAVYFRRTNPPPEDWERDYRTAAEDGHNIFRHWFLWGAIEQEPGVYDFSEYDPHFDLAAKHGIKVIIAEMLTSAPEWAFEKYAHARLENRDGTKDPSGMNAASVSGGFPGLSLNDPDVRAAAGRFLRALAERYRDHPAMGGYDLANEMKFPQTPGGRQLDYDFSPATQAKFRLWLKDKYTTLEALGRAWHRLSYTRWDQVEAPRHSGPYPDVLDWHDFRIDDFHEQVQWRANVLREADPDHPITSHSKATPLSRMHDRLNHDWAAADIVELFGFTWGAHKAGIAPWKQFNAVDLTRSAARGKPFWHAEAIGGPTWNSDRGRGEGKVVTPEQIRLWNMVSFAGGAQGILNPRWRPLLGGVLFGAYGFYGMDGSRTDRSAMASSIAKWGRAEAQKPLWAADPIKGDIGIVVVQESQLHAHAYSQKGGDAKAYVHSVHGAYRGFFDNNIQADWVYIDHIDDYEVLYLPHPLMLKRATAERLKRWVAAGGTLISEGAPGYFAERGIVGEEQPNSGLAELFGVRESYVEFGRNIHEDMTYTLDGRTLPVGLNHQEYELTGAQAVGRFDNGAVAVADNRFGQGRTRLIGAFPGYAHYHDRSDATRAVFADLLAWAGVQRHVTLDADGVVARLHRQGDELYLWIINHNRSDTAVDLRLASALGRFSDSQLHWGLEDARVRGSRVRVTVRGEDATVLKLVRR